MKNIVLIGMMSCGKTTIGKRLSERCGLPLVDTDALIEERAGCPIRDIFRDYGEGRFRDWEYLVSKELSRQTDLIIACGGGLPLQEEAIAMLKKTGLVFWLDRDPGLSYDEMEDMASRPLAQAGREDFIQRYAHRAPIYRRWADYIISGSHSPEETEAQIAAICTEVLQA